MSILPLSPSASKRELNELETKRKEKQNERHREAARNVRRKAQLMSQTSAERIEAARELIAKAKASGILVQTRRLTKQDEVRLLRGDIEGLRAEGATWTQVAELLEPVLHAGADTIRLAIGSEKRSGARTKPKAKSATKLKRAANASVPKTSKKKNQTAAEPAAKANPAQSEPRAEGSTAHRFHKLEEKL